MPKRFFYCALALFSVFVFYRLGSWGVLETSEARYAEMSWEMYQTGDLLHPTFLQLRHYHKPPLTYAITAGAYHLFGPGPFATRFFLQIALLLQVLLVYRIGRLIFKTTDKARIATLVYLSFPILLVASRSLTTDLYLVTFLLLGVWCWLRGELWGRALPWTLAAYAAWGLACLTKGAGVVILPAVLLPAYYLLFPPVSWWKVVGRHFLGASVFALIGLSWYAVLINQDASFFNYFLIEQTIKRYATDQWQRAEPWYYYVATVSATALPFAWLAVAKAKAVFRAGRADRWVWFAAVWFVAPLLFYSFAQSKLILYVLPAYPGLALLSVPLLARLSATAGRRTSLALSGFFGLLFVALLLAPFLSDDVNGGLLYSFWGAAAGAMVVGGAGWVYYRPGVSPVISVVLPALLFNLLLLPLSAEFLAGNELLVNSPQPVVDYLQANDLADRDVYLLHRKLPAVAFGLEKNVTMLYGGEIGRDTLHLEDNTWCPFWRNVYDENTRKELRLTWRTQPSLVIGYRTQDSLDLDLLQDFGERKKIGRYTVYY